MVMSGATVAVAAQAALIQAVRASGVLVRVEPEAFLKIAGKNRGALVVASASTVLRKKEYHYLTNYKGLAFYTKSPQELILPGDIELVAAKQIWMPA
ncbi:MAG: hypothetical protein FWH51_02800 [Dehalococcoidia bacterium]|nr:hypothetical protein [Dehalococcoidia bacterium]